MSHRKERKNIDCLNCGAVVYGKFCHICGQDNVEPKENFWNLFTHFIYDITHFDGKFFSTVKLLLLKPGFLSREYINGRRNSYLNPIRMYVFTSAFFFIYFFSVYKTENYLEADKRKLNAVELVNQLEENKKELIHDLADTSLSLVSREELNNKLQAIEVGLLQLEEDKNKEGLLKSGKGATLTIGGKPFIFKNIHAYDSVQAALPANSRDSWIVKTFKKRLIGLDEKYGNDWKSFFKLAFDKFIHAFPQMLFISLPIFAFMLKLIYYRRKNFYYGDHGIYAVHVYCAMFIIIFIIMNLSRLESLPSFEWLSSIIGLLLFYMLWYIYKSMRNFYQQSRLKTIVKYFLLFFIYNIMMAILFIIFFTFSVFTLN